MFAAPPIIQTAAIPITIIISYSLNAAPLRHTDHAVVVVKICFVEVESVGA